MPEQSGAFLQHAAFYTQFEAEIVIKELVFLGGSTRCVFTPAEGSYQFKPQVNEYLFKAGLRYGPLEVGMRHECNHRREYMGMLGGYEEYYLRISTTPRVQPGN